MPIPPVASRPASSGAIRPWLRLARLSNAPTILTNTLAGTAMAGGNALAWQPVALAGSILLFYIAGMLLNDYADRAWDATHRPERPIPAGEIKPASVRLVASLLLLLGLGALAQTGRLPLAGGILLTLLILAYNRRHKGNPLAPLLMALCRFMVYAIAFLAATKLSDPRGLLPALPMTLYVLGITLLARHETRTDRPPWLPAAMLLMTLPALALLTPLTALSPWSLAITLTAAAWVLVSLIPAYRRPYPVGPAIGRLLAGLCLLDASILAASHQPRAAITALLAFILTRLLQSKIPPT